MKLTSFYEMLATLPGGVYVPVRFTSRKNQISKDAVKRDRRFFVDPYPRRLERESPGDEVAKAALSSQFFKSPWPLVKPGFEPVTFRSADRRSPNWADQAAVNHMMITRDHRLHAEQSVTAVNSPKQS